MEDDWYDSNAVNHILWNNFNRNKFILWFISGKLESCKPAFLVKINYNNIRTRDNEWLVNIACSSNIQNGKVLGNANFAKFSCTQNLVYTVLVSVWMNAAVLQYSC